MSFVFDACKLTYFNYVAWQTMMMPFILKTSFNGRRNDVNNDCNIDTIHNRKRRMTEIDCSLFYFSVWDLNFFNSKCIQNGHTNVHIIVFFSCAKVLGHLLLSISDIESLCRHFRHIRTSPLHPNMTIQICFFLQCTTNLI